MKNNNFENVSIVGRIAYGIMCAEEYLIYKYPDKNWKLVTDDFWKITKLDLWDEWMEEVIEIIPEYLFEFKDYKTSNFEYLSEEKYNELKRVYDGTNDDVNTILKLVYDLANSHAYSSIKGKGNESLNQLEKIIQFLENRGVQIPKDREVQTSLFSERNGWGNPIDGESLSRMSK